MARASRPSSERTDRLLAADDVRMSTEHQQYSTRNQAQTIRDYAKRRGIRIVRTYSDGAKSGLVIGGRMALQQMIANVDSGAAEFSVILVYDVTRWGRFQDADESAYDEYRCRKVGMQVAYCAELFEDDGLPTSTIVKSVKRAMAGEYSRELSVKVFAGQCCLIEPGYRQGGTAGVGLRRALLNDRGEVKTELNRGEHKSLQTDRVVLVPGPDDEVRTVRRIYDRFLMLGRIEDEIAAEFNARGILTDLGRAWTRATVRQILTNEKYIGNNVCNRRSVKLRRKRVANAPDIWIRADGAFEAIVDPRRFRQVQAVVAARNRRFSDEEMLERLTRLFQRHGDISGPVIDEAEGTPSSGAYAHRFGSLLRAYSLVGVTPDRDYRYIEANRLLRQMHGEAGTEVQIVPIAAITVENPRERSEKTFRAPVDSIGKVGRKKPITLAQDDAGAADGYRLVCGQGRMEAYIALGETHVPASVVDATEVERLLRSVIEKIARRQQRPLELREDVAILRD
ncbi:recombinase family protein [Rhodovulum viride]|uniref:recombinase family protein n=1 Tax=Rhodovulum viride TaxID=1231134 RepID=UPI0011BEEAD7|nr:recombinase family protein [Rhodovulum viride]